MNCRHCGKPVPEDFVFCPFCGKKIESHLRAEDAYEEMEEYEYEEPERETGRKAEKEGRHLENPDEDRGHRPGIRTGKRRGLLRSGRHLSGQADGLLDGAVVGTGQ